MTKKLDVKQYLGALAEPNRLAIMALLKEGEKCACEIHPRVKVPQNLCSHHLKVLKDVKLLKSRRNGVEILYSRNEKVIKDYQRIFERIIL